MVTEDSVLDSLKCFQWFLCRILKRLGFNLKVETLTNSPNFLRKGLLDDPRLEALRERLGKSSKEGLSAATSNWLLSYQPIKKIKPHNNYKKLQRIANAIQSHFDGHVTFINAYLSFKICQESCVLLYKILIITLLLT